MPNGQGFPFPIKYVTQYKDGNFIWKKQSPFRVLIRLGFRFGKTNVLPTETKKSVIKLLVLTDYVFSCFHH